MAAATSSTHRGTSIRDKDGVHAVGSSRESLDSGRDPRDSRDTADSSSVGHVRRSRESETSSRSKSRVGELIDGSM